MEGLLELGVCGRQVEDDDKLERTAGQCRACHGHYAMVRSIAWLRPEQRL